MREGLVIYLYGVITGVGIVSFALAFLLPYQ